MKLLKKMFIILLSLSVLFLQFPNAAFAKFYAMPNASTKITKKAPQVLATPDEDIPVVERAAPPKKGGSKLLWYVLGLGVVAGLAASGGGGDDGPGNTGSFTGTW